MKNHPPFQKSKLCQYASTDKGVLFSPSKELMRVLGLPSNPTFYPTDKKIRPYVVGDIRANKKSRR